MTIKGHFHLIIQDVFKIRHNVFLLSSQNAVFLMFFLSLCISRLSFANILEIPSTNYPNIQVDIDSAVAGGFLS